MITYEKSWGGLTKTLSNEIQEMERSLQHVYSQLDEISKLLEQCRLDCDVTAKVSITFTRN